MPRLSDMELEINSFRGHTQTHSIPTISQEKQYLEQDQNKLDLIKFGINPDSSSMEDILNGMEGFEVEMAPATGEEVSLDETKTLVQNGQHHIIKQEPQLQST